MNDVHKDRQAVGDRPSRGPVALALVSAVAVHWVALYVAPVGLIAAGYGVAVGLVVPIIVWTVAAVVLTLIASSFTGNRHAGAATLSVFSAAMMLVMALAHDGTLPMLGAPALRMDLVHPVIAIVATLVWGAFIGPVVLRVLGALVGAALIALAFTVFAPDPSPYEELTRTPTPEEAFARYSDGVSDELSTDAPGMTLAQIDGSGSLVVTANGGVAHIRLDDNLPDGLTDRYPCWYIAEPNDGVETPEWDEPELTAADYSESCVKDADGWRRTDDLAFAHRWGNGFVFVESVDGSFITGFGYDAVRAAGGSRPANADEVAAILAGLRPINDDEIRAAYEATNPEAREN